MIRLECKDGVHYKFWEAEIKGSTLHVHFGRIGTEGQSRDKKLSTPAAAQAELDKVMREKLAHGYVKKGSATKSEPPKKAPGKKAPGKKAPGKKESEKKAVSASAPLLLLAELIAPGHAKTRSMVALALSNPAAYAKKYEEELEDRNAEDDPVDPFLALVTALTHDDVRLASGVDWKESAEEIQASIEHVIVKQKKLRRNAAAFDAKKVFAFYDEDAHLKTKTDAFIELCGRALSAHGLALVELDIGSDSHELTVIPLADVAEAQALAKKGGGGLISHAPKTPLKTPLAKAAPKAKAKAKVQTLRLKWNVDADDFSRQPGLIRWTGYAVGETDEKGRTAKVSTRKTLLVDCATWPPKESLLMNASVDVIFGADGSRILHRVWHETVNEESLPRPSGVLRIERPKKPAVDILEKLPDDFDIDEVGWAGELAVIFPSEPTIRGKKSRRPLVWNGQKLSPAKGLPDLTPPKVTRKDGFTAFRKCGFARTGDGRDVIIWGGQAFVAKGDTFVKMCDLVPDLDPYETTIGVPAPGGGFFYVNQTRGKSGPAGVVRLAEKGRCTEVGRLAHLPDGAPRLTPDGCVLIGLNRYGAPKKPVLAIFHPATNEITYVPPELLAVRKDDPVDGYGVTPSSGKGEAYLWAWAVQDDLLRRVPWSAILSAKRVPAR
jgi:predicted DNA-binding WGR domain protein